MQERIDRRSFISRAGACAAVMLFKPTAFAKPLAPALIFAVDDLSDTWKQTVCEFITKIVPGDTRQMVNSIYASNVYRSPEARTFHDYYGPKFLIETLISPVSTIYGQWFEFDRRPLSDSENPCRRIKDLNMAEILRITYPHEIELYGRIVSPCSDRRPPSDEEKKDFRKTAARYRVNPERLQHLYTRNVTNGQRPFLAHGVADPNMSDSRGNPRKDLLLSAEDI